jgi:membrane protease YdiL (CAAX protease family)
MTLPMKSSTPVHAASDPLNPTTTRQPTFTRSVAGRDVLATFAATVLPTLLTLVLVLLVGVALEQDWLISLVLPLATLAACGGMWAALGRSGWSFRDLGFVRPHRSAWHFLWELPLAWIAAVTLTFLVGTLVGLEPSVEASASNSAAALQVGVWISVLTALCTVIVMPAVEEILFRRILFGWLERRTSVAAAVIGSAIVFGAAHIAPPVVLLQFLIGLSAAALVYVHRTLWASLALHVFNNGIVTAGVIATVL